MSTKKQTGNSTPKSKTTTDLSAIIKRLEALEEDVRELSPRPQELRVNGKGGKNET